MAPSAAPPTPQEIQRKLSVHSATRIKPPTTTSTTATATTAATAPGPVSGTESDSDSILTPDVTSTHAGFVSSSYHATSSSMPQPLSSIAERSPASGGEDSDEEEEDVDGTGWRIGRDIVAGTGVPRADLVLKSGYLSKKGARRKTWKKRWFVLRPSHLAFYKNEAEYKLLRLLDLADVHSCVPVQLKRHDNAFGLILPKRTYYLQAGSAKEVQEWVHAIEEARQALMATSTQNSTSSNPILIPKSATATPLSLRPPPISISPPNPNQFTQVVSSSDSEDAFTPHPPPPPGEAQRLAVTGSPTAVTFIASPLRPPTSPAPKEASKIILSGYLMKCGSKRRNWRKRWFVLTAEKLFYSRSHMDTKPHRVFAFSDILDAMDYDLPTHRYHPTVLTPSVSSPPSHGHTTGTTTGWTSDVSDAQQRNFTFKIVMTKRNLLLCAPSEEDEIKWLGAVRALIARRSGVPGQQQQQQQGQQQGQQQPVTSTTSGGESGSGVGGGGSGGGATGSSSGGGIKSKVRRLSVGTAVHLTGAKSTTGDETRDIH